MNQHPFLVRQQRGKLSEFGQARGAFTAVAHVPIYSFLVVCFTINIG